MFDAVNTGQQSRRLPVYLLLDTSGSMSGAKIQSVEQGVQLLYNELLNNPQALDTVYISVITFNSTAQIATPLTDLMSFVPPKLSAGGVTSLMDALTLLNQCLDKDVLANSPNQKGDYKPMVFILTDGIPTDSQGNPSNNWQSAIQQIHARTQKKIGTMIVIGIGTDDEIDDNVLKGMGGIALRLRDVTAEQLNALFRWVSASVSTASVAVNRGQEGGSTEAPALPNGVQLVF